MPIIRVFEGDTQLGEIEADNVPEIGDAFMWKTSGPFRVIDRTWNYPAEYNDVAYRVTLAVARA